MVEPRYPHMLPEERKIWGAFLAKHGEEYERFEYDVHVGELWPEHKHLTGKDLAQVKAIYRSRIDAVGYQSGVITIFEIKPHAGLGALGQIVAYLDLYEQTFMPSEELRGALVTYLAAPDIKRLLEARDIDLYIMEREGF